MISTVYRLHEYLGRSDFRTFFQGFVKDPNHNYKIGSRIQLTNIEQLNDYVDLEIVDNFSATFTIDLGSRKLYESNNFLNC